VLALFDILKNPWEGVGTEDHTGKLLLTLVVIVRARDLKADVFTNASDSYSLIVGGHRVVGEDVHRV
jgi:hypothetical protein